MDRLTKWVVWAALALVGLFLALQVTVWILFEAWECNGNEAAADRMRKMDQRALAALHDATRRFLASVPKPTWRDRVAGEELPMEFSVLRAKAAIIGEHEVYFHLSGCYDDKVGLKVADGRDGFASEIVLMPGDGELSEVLWRLKGDEAPSP